jgi:hypothetical protein
MSDYLKSFATSSFTLSIKSKNSLRPNLVEEEVRKVIGKVSQEFSNLERLQVIGIFRK